MCESTLGISWISSLNFCSFFGVVVVVVVVIAGEEVEEAEVVGCGER